MKLYMSSRRTIMNGEVVTFATAFKPRDGFLLASHDPIGDFEVSASRDSVMVHKADCRDEESLALLHLALHKAEAAMRAMRKNRDGPSLYPNEPTEVVP